MIGDSLCSRLQVWRIVGLVAYIPQANKTDLTYYGALATGSSNVFSPIRPAPGCVGMPERHRQQ